MEREQRVRRPSGKTKGGKIMRKLGLVVGLLMLVERVWKHWMVARFFHRPIPDAKRDLALVSILQPVLSGDPTMSACLERSLQLQSRYALELIWLADAHDVAGQRICRELIARYPKRDVQLIELPPPGAGQNPKTIKLIAGAKVARGDVICGLDDDTMLPGYGLERCLPFLDQTGVGLAFGLPYYVNFADRWSSMVSSFVNSNSLLSYIPYTTLTQPFTINSMLSTNLREHLSPHGVEHAVDREKL